MIDSVVDVLMEVRGIVESFPDTRVLVKYFHSHVIEDDEPRYITPTTPITEWKFPEESGGTDWDPIVIDIEDNHPDSNIIIITDGYFCGEATPINNSGIRLAVMTQNYNDNFDWDVACFTMAFSDIAD